MKFKLNIKINKHLIPLILSLLCITITDAAYSVSTVNDIASNINVSIAGVIKSMILIAYIAGVGFAMGGILQFKAHKDNPTQVPISKPIVLLGVAAFLLFLPTVMQVAGGTVFSQTSLGGSSGLTYIGSISS